VYKIEDLQNVMGELQALINNKNITAKISWRLSIIFKKALDIMKDFDEQRIKLCEKYANKDSDGKPIMEDGNYILNNKEKFSEEYEALVKEEVCLRHDFVEFSLDEFLDNNLKCNWILLEDMFDKKLN
jgi:hypothetical protein